MSVTRAYEEVIDFLAAGTSPRRVADYRPSEEVRARVAEAGLGVRDGLLAHDSESMDGALD